MKKILIFSLVYYPKFIGGAEVAVKEITDRISDDYQFHMVTLRKGEGAFEKIGNINVHRVGLSWVGNESSYFSRLKIDKYFFPFIAFYKTVKLHRENNFDIVWSIMANYAGFGALFFKLFKPKVKFLLTLQEGDPISHIKSRVWFIYPLFKLIFKKADSIQAISRFLADFGKAMGHAKRIEVIPNGVDLKIFSKVFDESEKLKIKDSLGKKEGDVFLVTTSRLTYKNATDSIISVLPLLSKNINLIIIGKGEEGVRLQKQAQNLGVLDRVKFLGFISYDEIPKFLSVCDIFVRASRSEGFGNSFIEAMAARLPVIATPVGGIVDFIDDMETGVFCSPDCPQSIAKSVNLLIENKGLKERIIKNAQDRVIQRYDWDTVAKQMKDLFSKIILNEKQ